ncbi:hypothetical protein LTS08_004651 [Lithohypha guttulata]|nr:hypothetical protein LTS08_004651 [Lithohypha guttulata]
MYLSTALVAGLAAATSAFLVPPHVSGDFKDARFRGGPPEHVKEFIHHLLQQRTTAIDLECPNCPYAVPKGQNEEGEYVEWAVEPADSYIHLEFDTHDQSLNLNGQTLLPFNKAHEGRKSKVITAHQFRTDDDDQTNDLHLNFALELMPAIPSPHKDDVNLIPIEFTVFGLSGMPVKVNTISLKLIQTPNNDLVIVNTEQVPFRETPGAEACEGATSWPLCRLQAIVASRMRSMLEATKEKANKVHEWVKGCSGGSKSGPSGLSRYSPPSDGEKPHPHHGHHAHHRHHGGHRYHRASHMLHQTLRFFIVPALLGIIGGLVASAVGMLVGQAIILIWFKAYRHGRRGPVRSERETVIIEEEKEEPLPQYENAPRYQELGGTYDVEVEAVHPLDDEKH